MFGIVLFFTEWCQQLQDIILFHSGLRWHHFGNGIFLSFYRVIGIDRIPVVHHNSGDGIYQYHPREEE
jgi:hypothetical protein